MTALYDPTSLVGRWRFERTIEDRVLGETSMVSGTLVVSQVAPGRLRWEESGLWRHRSAVLEVSRILWLDREAEDTWWVTFDDGRPFHSWSPGREVRHPCGADSYRGLVTGDLDRWTVRWEVAGPSKDYTMESVMAR